MADEDGLGYPGPACLLAGREDRIGGYAGPFRALTLAWLDAAFGDGPGPGPISGC